MMNHRQRRIRRRNALRWLLSILTPPFDALKGI